MENNLNNFQSSLLKKFGSSPVVKNNPKILYGIGALVILAGLGAGYVLSGAKYSAATKVTPAIQGANEAGSADVSTFKDTATGILKLGGIKGEGTHHLERPGGASQTVYLTSSVIDMSAFIDKKVQVWGQTIAGKRAGWLMDVGKIKVVE